MDISICRLTHTKTHENIYVCVRVCVYSSYENHGREDEERWTAIIP